MVGAYFRYRTLPFQPKPKPRVGDLVRLIKAAYRAYAFLPPCPDPGCRFAACTVSQALLDAIGETKASVMAK